MQKTVGLWIDHKKAVVVFVDGRETGTKGNQLRYRKHHRQSGVATPADDIRQRELTEHLNRFYDEVVHCIRDTESILILGPGEAKGELSKRLEKDNLGRRIVGIKTSDKMTDKQIVALVRGHFLNRPAVGQVEAIPTLGVISNSRGGDLLSEIQKQIVTRIRASLSEELKLDSILKLRSSGKPVTNSVTS